MDKNIRLYKFYNATTELLFIGPVLTLFLLSKGISFTDILLLQSVFSIAIFILEVPSGAVADLFGRKLSLVINVICRVVSLILLMFSSNFWILVISEILFAIGHALTSGADTSLLYDSLLSLKREDQITSVLGQSQSYFYYLQGVASIVGGILYSIQAMLPFIASLIFLLINFVIITQFKEPKIHCKEDNQKNLIQQMSVGISYALTHQKIFGVILFAAIILTFSKIGFWLYQPYFKASELPVALFGFVFFAFNMIAGYASKHADRFIKATKGKTMFAMNLMMVISFLVLGFFVHYVFISAIFLQQLCRGLYSPVINKYVNKHTNSNIRATVLSTVNQSSNLTAALFMPLVGLLKDATGLNTTHIVLAVVMLLLALIHHYYLKSVFNTAKNSP